MCATVFITSVVQTGIKIGDLTHHTGLALASDAPGDEMMAVDEEDITIPDGTEPGGHRLSREEERALVRDSTAGFAGMTLQTELEPAEHFCRLGGLALPQGLFIV